MYVSCIPWNMISDFLSCVKFPIIFVPLHSYNALSEEEDLGPRTSCTDFCIIAVNGWPFLYHWIEGGGRPSTEQCSKKSGPISVVYGLIDSVIWTIGASVWNI